MPLVACDGKMMMAGFAVSALKHYMRAYPEAAAADLKRIDGVGATILLHHMVYMSEVGYIQAILDAGFDLTHDGFTGEPGRFIHIMSRVMRFLFRRMTFPPNDVFHFATMSPHHVPTYLHFAAAYAYVGALELLLAQNKLDINAGNKLGMTPLHLGAYMGHLSIVVILLNAGANPLVRDERKRTPAAWAARRGHILSSWQPSVPPRLPLRGEGTPRKAEQAERRCVFSLLKFVHECHVSVFFGDSFLVLQRIRCFIGTITTGSSLKQR